MGIYSDAHIVYGWKVPSDTWLVDDLADHLDERLQGSGLGFMLFGGYDWDDFERDLILTVGIAPSYGAGEESTALSPDAFDYELSPALDRELRQQARDRLGITPQGLAQWHVGVSIG